MVISVDIHGIEHVRKYLAAWGLLDPSPLQLGLQPCMEVHQLLGQS
jgi:hypothetical protein